MRPLLATKYHTFVYRKYGPFPITTYYMYIFHCLAKKKITTKKCVTAPIEAAYDQKPETFWHKHDTEYLLDSDHQYTFIFNMYVFYNSKFLRIYLILQWNFFTLRNHQWLMYMYINRQLLSDSRCRIERIGVYRCLYSHHADSQAYM